MKIICKIVVLSSWFVYIFTICRSENFYVSDSAIMSMHLIFVELCSVVLSGLVTEYVAL